MWRHVGGHEYLVREISRGRQRSLGRRSANTERIKQAFDAEKAAWRNNRRGLKDRLAVLSRMARALRINRVPKLVADLARAIELDPDLSSRTLIAGTNSMYAYEAMGGARFDSDIMATADVDLLWDTRAKLVLSSWDREGLVGLLRDIDSTFRRVDRQPYRAVNSAGFMVDLIEPLHRNAILREPSTMSSDVNRLDHDLVAAEIKGLEWLVSCPKWRVDVIDERGYPAVMTVPDPRAYVIHKTWLSGQSDREPLKRKRDLAQAAAVKSLLANLLTQCATRPAVVR